MVFECEALQPIWEKFADLFGPTFATMQQFLWQGDLVQVAHFVSASFAVLQTSDGD